MPDRIKTIGVNSNYADPLLWASAEGNLNDGNRAVGIIVNDIAINALFRPNQSFPNGGLLKGNVTVTGEPNVGITFSNAADSRFCLSPSPNLDFEDLLLGRGGASSAIGFQNSAGSTFTRIIFNPDDFSNSIYPLKDTTTIVRNCVLSGLFLNNSDNSGELDLDNCITTDRILCRSNNLLRFKNSISLASDWYLGRPTDSGAESLVNYSRIKQNANANEFGSGSSNNTVNYDSTNDLVNFATNDFRTRTDSPLATSGDGGDFIGAFLQPGGATPVDLDFNDTTIQPTVDIVDISNITSISVSNLSVLMTVDEISLSNLAVLDFSNLHTNLSVDRIAINNIDELLISNITVQPTIDVINIEVATGDIELKNLSINTTVDSINIVNIAELSYSNLEISVTSDTISITNISGLSLRDLSLQPTADTIAIDAVTSIVISSLEVKPTVDTIAIELYTELEFSNLSISPTIDIVNISSGVMPYFGAKDLLMIDNTEEYFLIDDTPDYRII